MADNSFSKQLRLLSARDFSNLKVDSLVFKGQMIRIYYKKNNCDFSRIGISVSSKTANSVTRNRFKRLIRESFRNSNFRTSGFDFLCVVQRFSKEEDQKKLESILIKNLFYFFKKQAI